MKSLFWIGYLPGNTLFDKHGIPEERNQWRAVVVASFSVIRSLLLLSLFASKFNFS